MRTESFCCGDNRTNAKKTPDALAGSQVDCAWDAPGIAALNGSQFAWLRAAIATRTIATRRIFEHSEVPVVASNASLITLRIGPSSTWLAATIAVGFEFSQLPGLTARQWPKVTLHAARIMCPLWLSQESDSVRSESRRMYCRSQDQRPPRNARPMATGDQRQSIEVIYPLQLRKRKAVGQSASEK